MRTFFAIFVTFILSTSITVLGCQSDTSAFDKLLQQVATEMNKNCPMTIDADTRLDNAHVLPEKTLVYNYTVTRYTKAQLNIDKLKELILPGIRNTVKTHPDMKLFRDNDVTLVYNYKDKNGVFLFKETITPKMYRD